jgi:KUP system potassium uptake protein
MELGAGIHRLTINVGFAEGVDLPRLLSRCTIGGARFEMMRTSFFLSRERLIATDRPGMALWRERLFAVMTRNAEGVTRHFNLPPNRVIELGVQVEI